MVQLASHERPLDMVSTIWSATFSLNTDQDIIAGSIVREDLDSLLYSLNKYRNDPAVEWTITRNEKPYCHTEGFHENLIGRNIVFDDPHDYKGYLKIGADMGHERLSSDHIIAVGSGRWTTVFKAYMVDRTETRTITGDKVTIVRVRDAGGTPEAVSTCHPGAWRDHATHLALWFNEGGIQRAQRWGDENRTYPESDMVAGKCLNCRQLLYMHEIVLKRDAYSCYVMVCGDMAGTGAQEFDDVKFGCIYCGENDEIEVNREAEDALFDLAFN